MVFFFSGPARLASLVGDGLGCRDDSRRVF